MYKTLCNVLYALPVMGTEAEIRKALATARAKLPKDVLIDTAECLDGKYRWKITSTLSAPVWVRKTLRAVGHKFNGEFYKVAPSKVDCSGIKGIYYSVGRKRVER